ncbi:TPA: FAD-dependent oxidoreductase [Candidatus Micrarchaeota archaeon]|nr:FAD-dependent oxidoreductase [Candidatus Micrarchaeota archaeon]
MSFKLQEAPKVHEPVKAKFPVDVKILTQNAKRETVYDIIVLGGGPAALNAAIYGSRAGLSVLVLEKLPATGGFVVNTALVENWLGVESMSGFDLAAKMASHAAKFGAEIKTMTEVVGADLTGKVKKVKTADGSEYFGLTIIIATGTGHAKLGVPGEKEFFSKGISYCAPCDGMFFKGKKIAVVGGGNSAFSEAIFLSRIAKEVVIIHRRDAFRAEQALVNAAKKIQNISYLLNSTVSAFRGDKKLTSLVIKNAKSGKLETIQFEGAFIYVGLVPNTKLLGSGTSETSVGLAGVNVDEKGFIVTDEKMRTNIRGVFAAGDVRATPLRQIVTAASDGAIAAISAQEYIGESGIKEHLSEIKLIKPN